MARWLDWLSSRPEEEEGTIALEALDLEELKLIAAFLNCTRLGNGISPYRDAAYTLLCKIEDLLGSDFIAESAEDVDMRVAVQDISGHTVNTISYNDVEFEV